MTATTKKVGEYWQAVLVVPAGTKTIRYTSKDMFLTQKTALKQAQWWRHESLELGVVIDG